VLECLNMCLFEVFVFVGLFVTLCVCLRVLECLNVCLF